MGVFFMGSELQTMNGQNKLALWAERVSACRSSDLSVRDWCKENDICEQTYSLEELQDGTDHKVRHSFSGRKPIEISVMNVVCLIC